MEADKEKSIKPGWPEHPRLLLSLSKDCFNFSLDDSKLKEAMKNYSVIHEQSASLYSTFESWFRDKSFFYVWEQSPITEERSRHIWKCCWTPNYGCTFTFGDSTMWPKIGIIQHSIKIILYHANPCNHVLPTTSLVYIVFPYSGRLGQVYWGQVTAADTVACSCWLIVGYKHNYIMCRRAVFCFGA